MQWLCSSTLQLQIVIHVLHKFPKHVYSHVGKRTECAVARVLLVDLHWTL